MGLRYNFIINYFKITFSILKYRLYEQWNFTYFTICLNDFSLVTNNSNKIIRKASLSDVDKIINDIYPRLNGYGENDKKYLENPDKYSVFLCEKEKRFIHYFLVFEDPKKSPLMRTPINKKFINNESAYLGSAFTVPEERGLWIITYSVSFIIKYLKKNTDVKKVILLVHNKTPAAIEFYQRLGFVIIANAAPKNLLKWLLSKII